MELNDDYDYDEDYIMNKCMCIVPEYGYMVYITGN